MSIFTGMLISIHLDPIFESIICFSPAPFESDKSMAGYKNEPSSSPSNSMPFKLVF